MVVTARKFDIEHKQVHDWRKERLVEWIKSGYKKQIAVTQNMHSESESPQSLLILDLFRGHLVDFIKHQFQENDTHLAVILAELMSKLQPLNVVINKPFKDKNKFDARIIRKTFKCYSILVEIDGPEDDLVFNYEILGKELANTNEEEVLNFDNNNDEYEEIRVDNDWK
ncbi:9623_t:CDS:2 [Gigaspora margarita]|uniref:9623_t:CDS:1 n=1 Tax=Gigaspora margarita TaxID=4874 RepID=A0ABN7UDM2_GIGMA|nr:9623_t:CDS:2 [Gigaspora margarita]